MIPMVKPLNLFSLWPIDTEPTHATTLEFSFFGSVLLTRCLFKCQCDRCEGQYWTRWFQLKCSCHAIGWRAVIAKCFHYFTETEPYIWTIWIDFGRISHHFLGQSWLAENVVCFAKCTKRLRVTWIGRYSIQEALLGLVPLRQIHVNLAALQKHRRIENVLKNKLN